MALNHRSMQTTVGIVPHFSSFQKIRENFQNRNAHPITGYQEGKGEYAQIPSTNYPKRKKYLIFGGIIFWIQII